MGMENREQSQAGLGESRREWKVGFAEQLQKIGAAYNLLLEVSHEAGELLRQKQGSADEQTCREFRDCVEKAMNMLLEARRKAGTYCG
jgi:hypothetical protein